MTFNEALKHKKNILKNSSEFTKTLYDYIIIPSIDEEGLKYIEEFKNLPICLWMKAVKDTAVMIGLKYSYLPKTKTKASVFLLYCYIFRKNKKSPYFYEDKN
jgi:hypothetical protein